MTTIELLGLFEWSANQGVAFQDDMAAAEYWERVVDIGKEMLRRSSPENKEPA